MKNMKFICIVKGNISCVSTSQMHRELVGEKKVIKHTSMTWVSCTNNLENLRLLEI